MTYTGQLPLINNESYFGACIDVTDEEDNINNNCSEAIRFGNPAQVIPAVMMLLDDM